MAEQLPILQLMEDSMPEQMDVPKGVCYPLGSPHRSRILAGPVERGAYAGADLLAGLVTLWGLTLEHSVPEALHTVERTRVGAVH